MEFNHMKTLNRQIGIRILVAAIVMFSNTVMASAAVVVGNLQVEYRRTPIGIDVEQPRFSWQMNATKGERGYIQTAYRIVVKDAGGNVVWDTQRSKSAVSLGIKYAGSPLKAATRYYWTVAVWNQTGANATGTSWFETGLMNPDPKSAAWSGAQWIGGGDEELVLYSPYLAIFNVRYAQTIAPGSSRASFVYGANDSRLMDKNKNLYQVEN
jgi:alpha-L-rhamnosidase